MAYADFDYYSNDYKGTAIAEGDFPAVAERATDYIDYITRNRADGADVRVKKACCALAEAYKVITDAKKRLASGELESEKVGSWSVTYRSGAETAANAERELYAIATRYLSSYMYRGGNC